MYQPEKDTSPMPRRVIESMIFPTPNAKPDGEKDSLQGRDTTGVDMQTAGGQPYSPALFFSEESGASPMEYVLAASILVAVSGLMLLAMAKAG